MTPNTEEGVKAFEEELEARARARRGTLRSRARRVRGTEGCVHAGLR